MSTNTHTPGPWKAHFEEAYFVTGPDLGRVAMMMNLKGAHGLGGRRSGDESAANCRLIAAAPLMLEALEAQESLSQVGLLNAAPGQIQRVAELRRIAIAAATGEAA